MGITDYLQKIEELTKTNLELLKTLNDSLYTDKTHLSVNLGDEGIFVVPSFVSLENKINTLQNDFENLVNAPATSDAYFTFNGDSRAIVMKGYEQSPAPLVLETPSEFYGEWNDTFKDLVNPVPYLKFDLSTLPNDITRVIVRKVYPISTKGTDRFVDLLGEDAGKQLNWGDIAKVLDGLEEDKDYVLYDTDRRAPIRKGQGTGSYVIKSIDEDYIDENLDQHVAITLWNNIEGYQKSLSYLLFDQTIENDLQKGDHLVAWDGHAKYEIEDLNFNTNSLKLRVMYGSYINMVTYEGGDEIDADAKLRFFSEANLFEDEKYIKVPLEEDQYVYIAIAPVNERTNVRAPWGNGVLLNTYLLMKDDQTYEEYYKTCTNIGDILNEIAKSMGNTTSAHSNDELKYFMDAVPALDTDILKVVRINGHLDNSPTIERIRSLYAQKNVLNADLNEIQKTIDSLQSDLSKVDFQDVDGQRESLQNQINAATDEKNEKINSLIRISEEIALAANNSEVPIENAKYRIRGFFDFQSFVNGLSNPNITEKDIKGILVQYRYRNSQQDQGTAMSFAKDTNGDGENETFIFSDWNQLYTPLRPRIRTTEGNYEAEQDTSNINVPSFNQIDIPITQGEQVDVKLKVIYDFGYPFIQMTSSWSPITTFTFPDEYKADVQILDIIKENNDDIENNRFNNMLVSNGIIQHVEDKIMDQDKTYYHKPENISSGFYTADSRRIIPLSDKLRDLDNNVTYLLDEITGNTADQLQVRFEFDEYYIDLNQYEVGRVVLHQYKDFLGYTTDTKAGNYDVKHIHGDWSGDDELYTNLISLLCNIRLKNVSTHTVKIYSMFPGQNDAIISSDMKNRIFDPAWYTGIYYKSPTRSNLQTTNQIITFRNINNYDSTDYYADGIQYSVNNKLSSTERYLDLSNDWSDYYNGSSWITNSCFGMCAYPCPRSNDGLKMTYKEAYSALVLNPGDEIVIPVKVSYVLGGESGDSDIPLESIEKTIAFDIRTALYKEPLYYTVKLIAKYENTQEDNMLESLRKKYTQAELESRQYNTTVV